MGFSALSSGSHRQVHIPTLSATQPGRPQHLGKGQPELAAHYVGGDSEEQDANDQGGQTFADEASTCFRRIGVVSGRGGMAAEGRLQPARASI